MWVEWGDVRLNPALPYRCGEILMAQISLPNRLTLGVLASVAVLSLFGCEQLLADDPTTNQVHPPPTITGTWGWNLPPNLVTPQSGKRNHIFYVGDPLTFTLGGASLTYEVRDYWGNLVNQGPAGASITIPSQPPGWYKLYVYGSGVTTNWGDIVGGTTFVVFRNTAGFPARPAPSTSGGPDPMGDEVVSGLTGVGVERIPCQDANNLNFGYMDAYVAAEKQWYAAYGDSTRPRPMMIAFPAGTTNLAGVQQVVSRYMTNGVKYWEPRNEPQNTDAATFVNTELIPFYNAVKAVDPTAKVMGPGTVSIDNSCRGWLQSFFAAGGGNYLDAFSFHAYNVVIGDSWIGRDRMDWLKGLLAQYGKSQLEIWQTEQGYSAPTYGAYWPRHQGRWTIFQMMLFEQYGLPKEHNHYWYTKSGGFWDMPMWLENDDGGLNPGGAFFRVWSEELYGKQFAQAYDFGSGTNLYLGSLFTGSNGNMAAFMTCGITTNGYVNLLVSGGSSLHLVSAFGVATNLAVVGGMVTLPVPEIPVYVELPLGQSIQVVPMNWGTNLASQTGVTFSASGTYGTSGWTYDTDFSKLNDGNLVDWYDDSKTAWHGDTNFPSWLQLQLPATTCVNRVVINAGYLYHDDSTLTDYELQYDNGGQWVTIEHIQEPAKTWAVYTPTVRCVVDTFFSDRYNFVHEFPAVYTTKIRILVHQCSWGSGAIKLVYDAQWQYGQTGSKSTFTVRQFQAYGASNRPPEVSNGGGASLVTVNSATLNGQLITTGTATTVVSVFWGTTDHGTNTVGWDHVTNFGMQTPGSLSTNVTGLSANTIYYYRFYGSNTNGVMWAAPTSSTFITGSVWVQATQPNASKDVPLQGVFTLYRPASTTNGALTVNYTTSGTAKPGVDFQPLPSNVTFAVGATNVNIAVVPIATAWGTSNKTLVLTLSPNLNYIAASSPSNTATVTILYSDAAKTGPFKMKITFSGYNRSETLTNFPVLVMFTNLMQGTDFHYQRYPFLNANGYDLRFYDSTGITNLNYEIEKWTNAASPVAYVWVQVPAISASTSYIWAKWANPTNAGQLPCTTNGAVWPASSFAAVWHMGQTNALDSTANRNNGTAITGTGSISAATGIIGGAQYITGGGLVHIPDASSLDFTAPAATYSAWVNFNTLPGNGQEQAIMRKEQSRDLGFGDESSSQPYMRNLLRTDGTNGWTANNDDLISPPMTGQWYYVAFTYNGNVIMNFWNGVPFNTGHIVTGNIVADNYSTGIGAYYGNNDSGVVSRGMDAVIDEVRIEQVFRSTNWIWATYMTVASNASFAVDGGVQTSGTNCIITASAGANGSIVPSGDVYVPIGSNQTFAITGISGYIVTNVAVDGSFVGPSNSYSFKNVVTNHTISAFFGDASTNYTITASAGTNGSIVPSGAVNVRYGSNQTFTITGNTGYIVTNVVVDGSLVGASNSYTFSNVLTNHAINAQFGPLSGPSGFTDWSNKLLIAFSGYNRAETLTNFPALVVLNTGISGFSYGQFASTNGCDLRFSTSDGSIELNYEIEKWATSGDSCVWVQVPQLSSGCYIWAYWGNTNMAGTSAIYTTNGATWASDSFAGVWHMGQSKASDSTANDNNGIAVGSISSAAGIIGDAQYVTAGGHVTIFNSGSLDFTAPPATYSGWVKFNTLSGSEQAVIRKDQNRELGFSDSTHLRDMFSTDGTSGWTAGNDDVISPVVGQWYYAAFTYDGSVLRNFWNGVPLNAGHTVTGNINGDPYSTSIGAYNGNGDGGPVSMGLDAVIDEVRVEHVFRSTNWIWATYVTVASNASFNAYGSVLTGGGSATNPPVINNDGGASNITISAATLNGNLVSTGGVVTIVRCFWGTTDGGQAFGSWANSNNLGTNATGLVSKNISGLNSGTRYYYDFYATNSAGTSWTMPSTNFWTVSDAPMASAATNIGAVSFVANCAAAAGATNYLLDVSTDSGFAGYVTGYNNRPSGNVITYTVSGLTPTTAYYYRLRSQNSGGTSTNSAIIGPVTTLGGPVINNAGGASNITINAATLNGNLISTGGAATIAWCFWGTSDGGQAFGSWANSNNLGTNATGFISNNVSGLNSGTKYYYDFYATNSAGTSWTMPSTNFWTTPNAPVASAATSIGATNFIANWVTATGATNYFLDVALNNSFGVFVGGFNNLAVGNVSAYSVTGLISGGNYWCRLRSQNSGGTSTNSAIIGPVSTLVVTSPPTVNNDAGASNITETAATINGYLSSTGGAPTYVWVFWGISNSDTNKSGWGQTNYFGVNSTGFLSTNLTGLTQGVVYYYRFCASNSCGQAWAASTTSFLTVPQSGYKMKIQFSGYNRNETLTNFPVLVMFTNGMGGASFSFQNYPFLTAGGYDLRFYDSTGVTNLNYEIDQWTNPASQTGYVWVQVPAISTNTDYIWAQWGDLSNTNQLPCTTNGAVWPTNTFVAVWHMAQSNAMDSTANGNNGTSTGSINNVSGVIGGAQHVSGGGHVTIFNAGSLDFTAPAATYSAWVNFNTLPGANEEVIIRKEQNREMGFSDSTHLRDMLKTSGTSGWTAGNDDLISPPPVVGQWYYVAFTYDGSAIKNFWNGVPLSVGHTVTGNIAGTPYSSGIGAYNGNGDGGPVSMGVDAVIDEVRVEQVFRSTNWIWATYMTVGSNASFNAYGGVQAGDGGWLTSNIPPATWILQYFPGTPATNYASVAASIASNGMTVWQDYLVGIDPTKPESCFTVAISNSAGQIVVSVPSIRTTGSNYLGLTRYYDIEQCTNLLMYGTWKSCPGYTCIVASDGAIDCTNTAQAVPVMFYRAKVWLQ